MLKKAEKVIEAVDTVGGVARIARASRVISHTDVRRVFDAIQDEISEDRVYDAETGTFNDKEV